MTFDPSLDSTWPMRLEKRPEPARQKSSECFRELSRKAAAFHLPKQTLPAEPFLPERAQE
jgi:hypothetical protein